MKKKMYQSPEMDFKFFYTREDVLSGSSLDVDPGEEWDDEDLGNDEDI